MSKASERRVTLSKTHTHTHTAKTQETRQSTSLCAFILVLHIFTFEHASHILKARSRNSCCISPCSTEKSPRHGG